MAEQIGLYGGSFNPIHNGHLIVARAIAERIGLDRVIFLPSARPPHKAAEVLVDPGHRAQMVKLATQGEAGFEYSDFDLTREGPSYTIDTVAHFHERFGREVVLCWIIGADSLAELTTWRDVRTLVDKCRIVTAVRPGLTPVDWARLRTVLTAEQIARLRQDVVETPMIEISSTDIRRRVSEGRSIRYLAPESVRSYIESRQLYRTSHNPRRRG